MASCIPLVEFERRKRVSLSFIALFVCSVLIQANLAGASGNPASGNTALIAYYNKTPSLEAPKYRFWNGSAGVWNSGFDAVSLDPSEGLVWLQVESNTARDEYVLVAVTNHSRGVAMVYANSLWGSEFVFSNSTSASQFGASVAFEQLSGVALLVWNNGSADVPYAVWNGAAWSAVSSIPSDSCTSGANWTYLFPKHDSDEAILVYSDGQGRLCGQHWSGSAWDSQKNFENVTTPFSELGRFFSGAFEYSSGRAIVVWESSNGSSSNEGNINFANWTGSGWSGVGLASKDLGKQNDWISCASQKSTGAQASNVVECVSSEDTGSSSDDVNVGQWNGTKWVDDKWHALDASAEGDSNNGNFIDVSFIGETNKTIIAYIDNNDAFPTLKVCNTGSNCDDNGDFSTVSGSLSQCGENANARFPKIASDPFSNDSIIGWVSKDSWNKCTAFYNGSAGAVGGQATKLGSGRAIVSSIDSPTFDLVFNSFNRNPWSSNKSVNSSSVAPGGSILLSALWFDDIALNSCWLEWNATGTFANESAALFNSSNSSYSNFSKQVPLNASGWVQARIWASDSRGKENSSDAFYFYVNTSLVTPRFGWNSFNKTNSSEFNPGEVVSFLVRVTDDNGTSSVVLNVDGVNHSMGLLNGSALDGVWSFNAPGLGAGVHSYEFFASDGGFSSESPVFELLMSRNSTAPLNFYLNSLTQNLSVLEGGSVNASGFKNASEGSLDLLRNGTLLASGQAPFFVDVPPAGYWNYTLSYNETENYSAKSETLFADVFQVTPSPSPGSTSSTTEGSSGNAGFYQTPTPIATPSATPAVPSLAAEASSSPQNPSPGAESIFTESEPEVFYSIENVGSLRLLKQARVVSSSVGGALKKSTVVTITLLNGGGDSLKDVILYSDLPSGAGNFNETPNAIQGSQAEWRITGLGAGESKTFAYTLERGIARNEFDQLKLTAFATGLNSGFSPPYELILLLLGGSGVAVWYWRKHRPKTEEEKLDDALDSLSEEDKAKRLGSSPETTDSKK